MRKNGDEERRVQSVVHFTDTYHGLLSYADNRCQAWPSKNRLTDSVGAHCDVRCCFSQLFAGEYQLTMDLCNHELCPGVVPL